jgi:tRNA uridine 5-carboxymethylaminomethyl modification enzyme
LPHSIPERLDEALEIEAKYEGYLKRQELQVERLRELEAEPLPESFDYSQAGLGKEAAEKLKKHRPRTYGQASRLDGVTPADLSLLSVYMERHRRARSKEGSATHA